MKRDDVRNVFFRVELLRRRMMRPYFIELGLTVGQGQPRILKELRNRGAMSQRELADYCMLDVTTMSRTLDRLEKAGLIRRDNNPGSRRSWIIALTEEGTVVADKVIEVFHMADDIFCEGVSQEELDSLCEVSGRIEANILNKINQDESERGL